jgi:xanthine dehydrogenase YagS FAD-binding subunit
MRPYTFARPGSVPEATRAAGRDSAFLAGGTTLVDLMKLEVMTPQRVLDINRLPLRGIDTGRNGLKIGALERMSDVAGDRVVRRHYPMLAQALEAGASPQLRNMASIGGNLMQRTRCGYFRDLSTPCNKRQPGSGCSARDGHNRMHAVLGTSDSCVATHPSDLAVALLAFGAEIEMAAGRQSRSLLLERFYRLPGDTPHIENELKTGEIITSVTVPAPWATHSTYLKIRDRQSYEFALASAAILLQVRGGTVRRARIAVGGMGTKPWRLPAVEEALIGQRAGEDAFEASVADAAAGAQTLQHNAFKPALLRRTLVRGLLEATEGAR